MEGNILNLIKNIKHFSTDTVNGELFRVTGNETSMPLLSTFYWRS